MAGATLWLFQRRRACPFAGGRILVAAAATACAPTLPPCVSFAVKIPKRESQSEDSACPGPAQRPPPPAAGPRKSPVTQGAKGLRRNVASSLDLETPDRFGLRVIEHRRRQRPAEYGAGVEVQPIAA